ncbi:unnamed protein product [Discosporangium mesarthrocarpum]
METAAKYLKGEDQAGAVLMDRLYHAVPHVAGGPAPPFPFDRKNVGVSPQTAGVSVDAGQGSAVGVADSPRADASKNAGPGGELPLPPGWTQMFDPQRGLPYYYNSATGETQWERPPPPPQPLPQPLPQPQQQTQHAIPGPHHMASPHHQPHQSFGSNNAGSAGSAGSQMHRHQQHPHLQQQKSQTHHPQHPQHPQGSHMAPGLSPARTAMPAAVSATAPYSAGGLVGFNGGGVAGGLGAPVAGAIQAGAGAGAGAPALSPLPRHMPGAETGGPGGMSHGGVGMPGGGRMGGSYPATSPGPAKSPGPAHAAARGAAAVHSAPAPSGRAEGGGGQQQPADNQAMVSAINGMLAALGSCTLSGPEKKMLGDVNKAVEVLYDKLSRGAVEPETLRRVHQLVESLQARQLPAATAIQQALADTSWNAHRDWLKGMKHLTTLVSRRL